MIRVFLMISDVECVSVPAGSLFIFKAFACFFLAGVVFEFYDLLI